MILVVNFSWYKVLIKNRRIKAAVFFIVALLLIVGCEQKKPLEQAILHGSTMGTYYRVSIVDVFTPQQIQDLKQRLEDSLAELNSSLSTYRPDSIISHFNKLSSNDCVAIDDHLAQVYAISREIYESSSQKFNPAVGGLVSLWGFGVAAQQGIPSASRIESALANTDFNRVKQIEKEAGQKQLCKTGLIELDFSAVAKGYAVDVLLSELTGLGFLNVLVDIGGELKGVGHNARRKPWTIAVEKPEIIGLLQGDDYDTAGGLNQAVSKIISVTDIAVATSGNYRNYFVHEGESYAHTIDPETGYPVRHELLSATVVHPQAAVADAWATAMMTAGTSGAIAMAVTNQLAVYLIAKNQPELTSPMQKAGVLGAAGHWEWHSAALEPYLVTAE